MYRKRDKIISIRVSSRLLKEFNEMTSKKTEIYSYAGRNHYNFHGKTLKDRHYRNHIDKYSIADLLEEAIEIVIEKNENNDKM